MNKTEILRKKIELAKLELELAEVEAGRVRPKVEAVPRKKRRSRSTASRKEVKEFLLGLAAFLGRSVATQNELARACGLAGSTISTWMLGKSTPSIEKMRVVADFIKGYGDEQS